MVHSKPSLHLRILIIGLYLVSVILFVLGLMNPILENSVLLGLQRNDIYLIGSIEYFFEEREYFVGTLILVFTFIFPIFKYIFLGLKVLNIRFTFEKVLAGAIELINKWAMLDVFVVALIIINMKFNSLIVTSSIKSGTTYFAASVLIMMICSWIVKKRMIDVDRE